MTSGDSKDAKSAESSSDAVLMVEGHEVAVAVAVGGVGPSMSRRRPLKSLQSYVGTAVIVQRDELEDIVKPEPTSKAEYWSYCTFCEQNCLPLKSICTESQE